MKERFALEDSEMCGEERYLDQLLHNMKSGMGFNGWEMSL